MQYAVWSHVFRAIECKVKMYMVESTAPLLCSAIVLVFTLTDISGYVVESGISSGTLGSSYTTWIHIYHTVMFLPADTPQLPNHHTVCYSRPPQ